MKWWWPGGVRARGPRALAADTGVGPRGLGPAGVGGAARGSSQGFVSDSTRSIRTWAVLRGWRSFCTAGETGRVRTPHGSHAPFSSATPLRVVSRLTVLVHARLQALLQPAGLALVAVGLVHRAHPCPHLAPVGGGERPPQGVRVPPRPRAVGFGHVCRSSSFPEYPPSLPGTFRGWRAAGRCPASPVDEPPPHAPLEEAAAAVAGVDAVVLPAAAVPTHAALQRGPCA